MNQPVKTSVEEGVKEAAQPRKLFAVRSAVSGVLLVRARSFEDALSGDPWRCQRTPCLDDELFAQLMAGLEPSECREIEAIRADRIEWKAKEVVAADPAAEPATRPRVPVAM